MRIIIALLLLSNTAFAGWIDTDSGAKASNDGTISPSQEQPDMSSGHVVDTDSGARASNQ